MNYALRFSEQAQKHIKQHKKSGDKAVINKITTLLEEIVTNPYRNRKTRTVEI